VSLREHIAECMVTGLGVGVAAWWTWHHFPALSPAGGTLPLLLWAAGAVVALVSTAWGNR
jgi:hypothetical protein